MAVDGHSLGVPADGINFCRPTYFSPQNFLTVLLLSSRREGRDGGIGGERLIKELICISA